MSVDAPEIGGGARARLPAGHTYREISYEERGEVGYLRFDFYNGAMSTDQCLRLREAYRDARSRPQTKVIVLMGGTDCFSNGIHLNVIEAAADPAAESWRNLTAIDDLVREIIETDSHVVISALAGDAGAGGVPLALAADHVIAREDVVLNPYYQHMGGLYGSEYWTYLLPRRVGDEMTARLTGAPFTALGADRAVGDRPAGRRVRRQRERSRRSADVRASGLANAIDRVDRWLDCKRRRRGLTTSWSSRWRTTARGARALPRVLLRRRPQLPRRPPPVRLQARPDLCDQVRREPGARADASAGDQALRAPRARLVRPRPRNRGPVGARRDHVTSGQRWSIRGAVWPLARRTDWRTRRRPCPATTRSALGRAAQRPRVLASATPRR